MAQQRAAIIGLGVWGQRLVKALATSESVRIATGVSRTPEKLAAFGAQHGFPITDDFESVLRDPQIDFVIAATPHSLHPEHVARIAAAGKHAYVEKPFTLTKAGAEFAVDAVRKAGVLLGVAFTRRFFPAVMDLYDIVLKGKIGSVLHVEGQSSSLPGRGTVRPVWRNASEENPGGGMASKGIHVVDAMLPLAGLISGVWAQSRRAIPADEAHLDDVTSMLFQFKDGATGYLGTLLHGANFWRLHAFGDKGWAEVRDENVLTVCALGGEPQATTYPFDHPLGHAVEAFAEAIRGGKPFPVTYDEAINSSAVLEAINQSLSSGTMARIS